MYFNLDDDLDVLAARPDRLYEVSPQDRVLRRTVEQNVDAVTFPSLDVPEPQMGDQLVAVLQKIDTVIPEQVIAVPKISYDSTPQRVVDRRRPQEAEQLVEVPTIVSFSSLLPNAEQIVVTPGVGCRGGWGGPQGLPAGQSSTAFSGAHHFPAATAEQIVDIPVPRRGSGGIQGFHPGRNPTALPEQIVEFPVPLGGLHGFTPGQGFPALLDAPSEHFHGFLALLRVRRPQPARVQSCPPVAAHGLGRLMTRMRSSLWTMLAASGSRPRRGLGSTFMVSSLGFLLNDVVRCHTGGTSTLSIPNGCRHGKADMVGVRGQGLGIP